MLMPSVLLPSTDTMMSPGQIPLAAAQLPSCRVRTTKFPDLSLEKIMPTPPKPELEPLAALRRFDVWGDADPTLGSSSARRGKVPAFIPKYDATTAVITLPKKHPV
jgi:hypothetical protein